MAARSRLRQRPGLLERLRRAVGEVSLLRQLLAVPAGPWAPYRLDSSRVNYDLARALYRNTEDRYKLGAAFARPVVNSTAGFVGAPHFSHRDREADGALEEFAAAEASRLIRAVRNAVRDGDVFVRVVHERDPLTPDQQRFGLRLLPPEWVTPILDPLTGALQEVIIRYPVEQRDRDGRVQGTYHVIETLRRDARILEADGRAPAEVRERLAREPRENVWGLIPVVHIRNEPEEYATWGASDLEPLEPFLRAYHDVMLYAVQGARMFARPKVRFTLQDVDAFLERNFTPEEIQSGRLRFDTREVFLLQDGEEVAFITADTGLSAITTLLKFLFFCIVDVSETPEFAFGTAVSSSKASVSEQMVPFARKIRRKRGQLEEPMQELAGIYLAMWARVNSRKLDTYRASIGWEEIQPRDDRELAQTVATLVGGLTQAVDAGLMSLDAAADFLREFVPSMLPWVDKDADDDERRRVIRSLAMIARARDGLGLEEGTQGPEPEPVGEA